MRYRPQKRMASFRSLALSICQQRCLSKTGKRLEELTNKYGAFTYKGVTFHHPGHVGIIQPLDENLVGKDLELVDHLWFLYSEWDKIKHSWVLQLNQCRTMSDVHLLVPDEVKADLPQALELDRTLPLNHFDAFKETSEYAMMETLIFTNEILEQ